MSGQNELVEGEDFYMDGEFMVFTAEYHRKRSYCCGSGCRHCPYGDEALTAPPLPLETKAGERPDA